jgi:hypothetical protein
MDRIFDNVLFFSFCPSIVLLLLELFVFLKAAIYGPVSEDWTVCRRENSRCYGENCLPFLYPFLLLDMSYAVYRTSLSYTRVTLHQTCLVLGDFSKPVWKECAAFWLFLCICIVICLPFGVALYIASCLTRLLIVFEEKSSERQTSLTIVIGMNGNKRSLSRKEYELGTMGL